MAGLNHSQWRDATIALGSFVIVPAILSFSKVKRMDSKDHSEQMTDVRYRAVFWERANDFIRAMNNSLLDDLVAARQDEIDQATARETKLGGYVPPLDT